LQARAGLLARIRSFFAESGVLEVETPLLSQTTTSDPHLQSLSTSFRGPGFADGLPLYLQTSPEYAMKRLLAAGTGAIFQLCKAFRDGENGPLHNPEFTILEWYQPGDHHRLMDTMERFLEATLGAQSCDRKTYLEVFEARLGLDPHTASTAELEQAAARAGMRHPPRVRCPDDWLALLMSHFVEPSLGTRRPLLLYDYPASQAALSRVRPGSVPVAERFEVYYRGVELANGFYELADATEQRRRFETELEERSRAGLEQPPLDERLLAALEAGLPDCSGVALGVDRLLMLEIGAESIADVLTFPLSSA